jgi:hypothetical protein
MSPYHDDGRALSTRGERPPAQRDATDDERRADERRHDPTAPG